MSPVVVVNTQEKEIDHTKDASFLRTNPLSNCLHGWHHRPEPHAWKRVGISDVSYWIGYKFATKRRSRRVYNAKTEAAVGERSLRWHSRRWTAKRHRQRNSLPSPLSRYSIHAVRLISLPLLLPSVGLDGVAVGCRTCDQQVAGSNSSRHLSNEKRQRQRQRHGTWYSAAYR